MAGGSYCLLIISKIGFTKHLLHIGKDADTPWTMHKS